MHNLPPKGGFFLSQEHNQFSVELRFWLKIMSDHARLIKSSLQPDNPNQILIAVNLINIWERLCHKFKGDHEFDADLVEEILSAGLSFREYQRELLGSSLRQEQVTTFPPTFYNHLLNELEEFLKFINELQTGEESSGSMLGNHLVWVLDAAGHATFIGSNLDPAEALYREEAKAYENAFLKMYYKVVEMAGYYRSDLEAVRPVLLRFNRQITELMQEFICFLSELQEGLAQQQILGNLHSWLMDHMIREEKYYLRKIGVTSQKNQGAN
jgi:hypothetical protein